MRDRPAKPFAFDLPGPSMAAFEWDGMNARIKAIHPKAQPHGGVNSWHWALNGEVVAEAVASELGWRFKVRAATENKEE